MKQKNLWRPDFKKSETLADKKETRQKIKERMKAYLKDNQITRLEPQPTSCFNPVNTGIRTVRVTNKITNFMEKTRDSR